MQDDFITLLSRKLDEALSPVDLRVGDRFQAIYAKITPAPSCPFCGEVMKDIKSFCAAGVKERGEVSKNVVLSLLDSVPISLTSELLEKIISCVQMKLPEDKYVVQASNIKGVYQRRASDDEKFQERSYDLEMAAIRCESANQSRKAVGYLKTALDARMLKVRIESQMASPASAPLRVVPEKREGKSWTRDNRLTLMSIIVAVVATAISFVAALYPQEIKGFLRSIGG